MTEPSAIWSQRNVIFDKPLGLTQNVILSHARVALEAIISRIDSLHELVASDTKLLEFYPNPEIAPILSELCFHQGLASTILFDDSSKKQRESGTAFRLRKTRVEYVKGKCAALRLKVLTSRKIRNSMTHIDEYLADEMQRPKTGWMIDSAIGRRDQFTAKQHGIDVAYCRVFIASEDTLLHLGNEISLKQLREEATVVLATIWSQTEESVLWTVRKPGEIVRTPPVRLPWLHETSAWARRLRHLPRFFRWRRK
jgi:hypothetical protein